MTLRLPWHILGLAAIGAAAVVLAILEIGPPTSSARNAHELVTAERGVVQSTVTGSGNIAAGTDTEANFQTSGTLQHVFVKAGDHVVKGQLIATLDPSAAQLTVDQAQQSLDSADDQLDNAEQAADSTSDTSVTVGDATPEFASLADTPTTARTAAPATVTETVTQTAPTRTPAPAGGQTTTSAATTESGGGATRSGSGSGSDRSSAGSGSSGSSRSGSGSGGAQTTTTNADTIAANIASAQAAVDGAQATLRNAETGLHETHLYAPATGTVVTVQDISPGDQVSGSSSSSSASAASSASSASAASGANTSGSLNGTSSSSSTSSGFAEIVNTRKLTMTVAFDESDISKIKVGQPATVTLEALAGVQLGAKVSSISMLGTTSESVVSYDATLTLDQRNAKVKPGMSASAAVITGQASGVTLPNSAVPGTASLASLQVMDNGNATPTSVVVGVRGDSRTQIVSGLKAGQQVQITETLPSLGSSSSSATGSGTLGGATSGLGGAAGAAAGGFGGGRLGAGGGAGLTRRFGGGG